MVIVYFLQTQGIHTMNITILFPDSNFNDVRFTAREDSTVNEAVIAACDEWGIDPMRISIKFGCETIKRSTKLLSLGLQGDEELIAFEIMRAFGKQDFMMVDVLDRLSYAFKNNPDITCFIDADTFTDCTGKFSAKLKFFPETIINMCLVNSNEITTLCSGSLSATGMRYHECSLRVLDISQLNNLQVIQSSFLSGCNSLVSLSLPSLSQIRDISNWFLFECSSLRSLDLSDLTGITCFGNYFMSRCSALQSVVLPRIPSGVRIGMSFLSGCELLTSLNLSGSDITWIEDFFLSGCHSLTSVILPTVCTTLGIGEGFLSDCQSLTTLDLSSLTSAAFIGHSFLYGCTSLSSLDLSGLTSVSSIGNDFLFSCNSISTLDLSPLTNVTSIGTHFLSNCGASVSGTDASPVLRLALS